MDGFKNLEIKNFRGIEHLKIDDLSRVNVFLGQNSSGKSSILECLLLIMGMSNPDLPMNVNAVRARNYSNFADLGYMFPNYHLSIKPEISSDMLDDTKRRLALEMTYVFDEKAPTELQNGQIPTSETKTFLNTLKLAFEIENQGKKNYKSSRFGLQQEDGRRVFGEKQRSFSACRLGSGQSRQRLGGTDQTQEKRHGRGAVKAFRPPH